MTSTSKVLVALAVILSPGYAIAQDTVVQTFTGSGARNTRPFAVNDGWEIQWDAKGDVFQLFLYTAGGEMVGLPANQEGAGKGASYEAKGGDYYLQVNAIGDWTIKVVQTGGRAPVPPADKQPSGPTSSVVASFSGSGGQNTRPFAVAGPWEIRWDAKGDVFQLYLYAEDGEMVGLPANQQGPGTGASYQPKGGTYYLQVNAMGNWTVTIAQFGSQPSGSSESGKRPDAAPPVIATFSGSGGQNTRPFITTGPWEIQWDAKGDIFQLFLYTAAGELEGLPANQQGPGKGTSYQPKAGQYYLQVNALGGWDIRIVPVR